jgi:hypothetical protein
MSTGKTPRFLAFLNVCEIRKISCDDRSFKKLEILKSQNLTENLRAM